MKLINTTNSHAALVKSQLASTDALLVEGFIPRAILMLFLHKPQLTMNY